MSPPLPVSSRTPPLPSTVQPNSVCLGHVVSKKSITAKRALTALEGFSEALHKELLPEWNIKVIIVQPGGVRTEWAKGSMVDRPLPPAYDTFDSPAKKMRDLYKTTQPMGDAVKRASISSDP